MVSKFLTKHSIMFTLHIMASISVQNDSKWGFASQWIPIINTQARDTYNSTLLQTWVFNRGLRVAVCLRLLHVFPLFHLTNIINTNTFLKKEAVAVKWSAWGFRIWTLKTSGWFWQRPQHPFHVQCWESWDAV